MLNFNSYGYMATLNYTAPFVRRLKALGISVVNPTQDSG